MKKVVFISALLIVILCTFNTKYVNAASNYKAFSYNNDYVTMWIDENDLSNTNVFTVSLFGVSYNFKKPVIVLMDWDPFNGKFMDFISYSPFTVTYGESTNIYNNHSGQIGGYDAPVFDSSKFVYNGVPVFNSFESASAYSMGDSYDADDLIGGIPFDEPSIGQEYYENHIYNFDKVFNVYRHSSTPISWAIAWSQPYDSQVDLYEDTGYHRVVGLTVKYPTRDSLASYMSSIWNGEQSVPTVMEFAYSLFTSEGLYDSHLTYKETTIWIDIDDLMQNSNLSDWWQLNHTVDNQSYVFIMRESGNTFWEYIETDPILNPNGIMKIFSNYYSTAQQFCLSLPYLQFVKAQMYTYNVSTNTVYNPDFIFWIDVTSPDGTVQERRNFGSPTNITDDDLVEPSEDNDNVGVDFGVPNPSEDALQSNYYKSINDSYNNIYNNYYYDSDYNKDLLDYLLKYKDGGSQEDIQDAFGYVNSTVDSVSNVPLLLGKLFNGFFPVAVIRLFSALFIIFAVFIVIKIIRHLFL